MVDGAAAGVQTDALLGPDRGVDDTLTFIGFYLAEALS